MKLNNTFLNDQWITEEKEKQNKTNQGGEIRKNRAKKTIKVQITRTCRLRLGEVYGSLWLENLDRAQINYLMMHTRVL